MLNKAADALSRVEPRIELHEMTTSGIVDISIVREEVDKDEELQQIVTKLKKEQEVGGKFEWKNNRLLYKGRLVLPRTSSLIPRLLHTFHDSVLGGHSGFLRTYKRMSGELY